MTRPNTREQIVQAGLKCLVERGFNGVGVQDITTTAGVPKGSFYNHFESKEALGAEIVERYGADSRRREILTDRSVPPLERLRRHYERLNRIFVDANFQRGCILGNFSAELSSQSELIRDALRKLYARWTADVEAAIAEAQEQGAIGKDHDRGGAGGVSARRLRGHAAARSRRAGCSTVRPLHEIRLHPDPGLRRQQDRDAHADSSISRLTAR